jgi:outer membrane protein
MKKLLQTTILVALVVLSVDSFGQTTKGKVFMSGNSDLSMIFGKSKVKDNNGSKNDGSEFSFNLNPQIGYFVIDNLAVGAGLPISFASYKSSGSNPDNEKISSVVFSPFAQYYFGSGKVKPFGYATVGFGSQKDVYDPNVGATQTDKAGVFTFTIGAGAAIFLNDNVSFDAGLGYQSTATKAKENNPDDSKTINSGFGLSVGITVLF